jgi:hypothetical protein
MSSFVNDVTAKVLAERSVEALTTGVGVFLVGLLILLLVEREVLAQVAGPRLGRLLAVFDVVIAPLLVTFVVIVVVRFAQVA